MRDSRKSAMDPRQPAFQAAVITALALLTLIVALLLGGMMLG